MNAFVAPEYAESVWRLALGIQPIDALQNEPAALPLRADLEIGSGWNPRRPSDTYAAPGYRGMPQPVIDRRNTARHVLLYHPRLADADFGGRATVRFYDHLRRFVPRRISMPLVPEANADDRSTFARRIRQPFLYPGAGYEAISGSNGLRGRVMRSRGVGQPPVPLRWGRIVARAPGPPVEVVGRAFTDDRGEFLLLVRPAAIRAAELVESVVLRVVVSGPAVEPVPVPETLPQEDIWWDLPVETVPAAGDAGPVLRGEAVPDGYATSVAASRQVRFHVARILTGLDEPDFIFSLP